MLSVSWFAVLLEVVGRLIALFMIDYFLSLLSFDSDKGHPKRQGRTGHENRVRRPADFLLFFVFILISI